MKKIIVCLAAIGLLSGCNLEQAVRDPNTLKAMGDTATAISKKEASPEEEAQIGREAASMLLGAKADLVESPEMMRYVNAMGSWIAKQTGRNDITWRFGVLNSPNVNAFAAPDGYIFVTRGLLAQLNNESELAGVIAHEIAHVVKRHYIIAMKKKDVAGAFSNLAATAVKSSGRGYSAEVATPLFNLTKNMYSSGLDKGDEYEADRLGVVYATRAGYDPYGLPRVLNMYAANAGSEGLDLLISTHPSPQDRLSKLGEAMGDKFAAYEANGVTDSKAFKQISALARSAK